MESTCNFKQQYQFSNSRSHSRDFRRPGQLWLGSSLLLLQGRDNPGTESENRTYIQPGLLSDTNVTKGLLRELSLVDRLWLLPSTHMADAQRTCHLTRLAKKPLCTGPVPCNSLKGQQHPGSSKARKQGELSFCHLIPGLEFLSKS